MKKLLLSLTLSMLSFVLFSHTNLRSPLGIELKLEESIDKLKPITRDESGGDDNLTINAPSFNGNCPDPIGNLQCFEEVGSRNDAKKLVKAAYSPDPGSDCRTIQVNFIDSDTDNNRCGPFSKTYNFEVVIKNGDDVCERIPCSITYNGEDTEPPSGDLPEVSDLFPNQGFECIEDLPTKAEVLTALEDWVDDPDNHWTDNCGGGFYLEVDIYDADLSDPCEGGYREYQLEVFDECGKEYENGVEFFRKISFPRSGAPVINYGECPANRKAACYGDLYDIAEAGKAALKADGAVRTSCGFAYSVYYTIEPRQGKLNCSGIQYDIKYRVEDECGRKDYCTQRVTIDNDPPTFTHRPGNLRLECGKYSVERDIKPWLKSAQGEASCDLGSYIINDFDAYYLTPCGPYNDSPYSLKVTWYIEDQCGQSNSYYAYIIIVDTEDPMVEKPADRDIGCSEGLIFDTPVATDNCDDDLEVSFTDSSSGDNFCCSYTRTWTFTDNCGNSSSVSQTLNVVADTPPILTPVHPLLVGLQSGDNLYMECDDVTAFIRSDVVATDGCPNCPSDELEVNMGDTRYYSNCERDGYLEKMECWWYTEDHCGNLAIFNIFILTVDTKAPEITVPDEAVIDCNELPTFGEASALDACDESVDLTYKDQTIVWSNCEIHYIRTWTATDDCGNESTATQRLRRIDNEDPVFTFVPADLTITCNETITFGMPTASDDCGSTVIAIIQETAVGGVCGSGIRTTRTWSATDACDNSVTASQTITVLPDQSSPVFSSVPADITVQCADDIPEPVDLTAVDDCAGSITVSPTEEITTGSCENQITMVRTWTAIDDCGNSSSVNQSISVNDNTAPAAPAAPADLSVQCADNIPPPVDLTASDNCDGAITVSPTAATTPGNGVNQFTMVRTWTFTDACGNSSNVSQTITVNNETPPALTCPGPLTLSCEDATLDAINSWLAQASAGDNCNGDVQVMVSSAESLLALAGNCGSVDVYFTATDNSGNKSECVVLLTITDDTAPVFSTVPPDATIDCSNSPDPGSATATDNCGTVSLSFADMDNMIPCDGGSYTRTWTAVDDCGNETQATQTITRTPDTEAPMFTTVPPDLTIVCGDPIDLGEPTASDNCGEVEITFSDEYNAQNINFDNCNNGYGYDIFRTWTATDNCGNSTSVVQSAWVVPPGYSGPVFDFIPPSTTLKCGEITEFGEPVCVTACGALKLTHEDFIEGEDCATGMVHRRVWTAIDDCGNIATAAQTLTLDPDTEAPTFENFANKTYQCGEVPVFDSPICVDNCTSSEQLQITHEDVAAANGCSVTRNWIALDICGNEARTSQTISLSDNQAPAFSFAPENQSISCGESIEFAAARAEDDCTNVSISFSDQTIEIAGGIKVTRTWSAVDACGNERTVSRSIEQIDNTAPVFSFVPVNHSISCGEAFNFGLASAEDACGSVQLSFVDQTSATDCAGMIQVKRTWIALDEGGNETRASQTIVQVDNEAPIFNNRGTDQNLSCGEVAEFTTPTAQDGCSELSLSFSDEVIEATATIARQITRTWTAIDACGNISTTAQKITYALDREAPVFTLIPESQTIDCGGSASFGTPEVLDNCSEVTISYKDDRNQGDCASGFSFTRTWTARDAAGNETQAAQVFTVAEDRSAPLFTEAPEDQLIECNDVVEFGIARAVDNCSNVELSSVDNTEIINGETVHSRSWTAIDACGNAKSYTQFIRVVDTQAPQIVFAPENKSIDCSQELRFDDPLAEDACSAVSVNFTDTEEILNAASRKVTREWIFTDESGNVNTTKQTITVEDGIAPVFSYVPSSKRFSCGESLVIDPAVVIDNCSEVQLSYEDEAIVDDCSNGYQFRRVWTAVDAAGNVSIATQEFSTESDNTAPTFTFVPEAFEINYGEAYEFGTPEVGDNCSSISLTFVDTEERSACGMLVNRSWTAIDQCGNEQTASQTITMKDIEAPVFTQMPTELYMTYAEFASWQMPATSAVDNFSELSFGEMTETNNTACEERSYTYNLTAADACGNETTHMTTVYITDAQPESKIQQPAEIKFLKDNAFSASVAKGIGPYNYNWSLLEGKNSGWEINSEANQSEVTVMGGLGEALLEVSVTDANNCTSISTIKVKNVVNDKDFFLLTPNPTPDQLQLYFSVNKSEESRLFIYDMLGRKLNEIEVDNFPGINKLNIDATRFSAGTYILQLDTGENTFSQKFVKTK